MTFFLEAPRIVTATVSLCITSIWNVALAVHKQRLSILVAFTRLMPFLFLNCLALLWAQLSPTNILASHPRIYLWTIGLLNSKLVLHLMLAHLCGEEYHPFRKTLVPIFYVAAHWAFSYGQGIYPVSQDTEVVLLKEFFFLAVAAYIHIVVTVIYEIKTVLNIPVFTISDKAKAT
jgi:ethanolaminephosphotransferase